METFIVWFLVYLSLWLLTVCAIYKKLMYLDEATGFKLVLLACISIIPAFILWPVVEVCSGASTGMYESYSEGIRDGYLTKLSYEGFVWKTWEGELQMGTGNMAALQEPYRFSAHDPEIVADLNSLVGKKVRITYRRWLLQPFRYGGTEYEVISVQALEE